MSLTIDWIDEDTGNNKISDTPSELKSYMIEYVGNKLDPKDSNITVDMIIDVLADEFPEVVLSLAEENWIRGYEQAIQDPKAFGFET
jgi:hypothetical protein